MTRFDPTLIVTRIVVERNQTPVYDELLHQGVNIIRGENSSGKSTVLNFIFYGLGGDLNDWSTAARLCSRVTLEVRINGLSATLSREISPDASQQPMDIFGGDYERAKVAPRSQWNRYAYRSAGGRESFSQAIFRLMGVPEVSSDLSGNITMHQILRLLYADQLSPIEDIFRFERFDQANLRDTVGRLLCGAYDSALYDNEQRIRMLTRQHDEIEGQLKSIFSILGKAGQGFTLDWLEGQFAVLNSEKAVVEKLIEEGERKLFSAEAADQLTLSEQNKAYDLVQSLQEKRGHIRNNLNKEAVSIADSDAFISSLRAKMDAMRDSASVLEHVGAVSFHSCPVCYSPTEESDGHCHLCKSPYSSEESRARLSALIIDTGLQIKQSEQLQVRRRERSEQLAKELDKVEAEWQVAARRLNLLQRLPSSEAREKLRELHRKAGYIERQIEDLEQKSQLAESVRQLSEKKLALNNEISYLKATNEALRVQQSQKLSQAYTFIANEVKVLLHNDLRRQDVFEDPKSVSFTFSANKILVDDENYFSASSRAILKSSFYLGFLAAATKVPFFRHPRFCMIDTHENMGVEAIRSQNFQLQALRVSRESKVEHQIIIATAMIEPELEDEAYTIGAFSTSDDKTLDIR